MAKERGTVRVVLEFPFGGEQDIFDEGKPDEAEVQRVIGDAMDDYIMNRTGRTLTAEGARYSPAMRGLVDRGVLDESEVPGKSAYWARRSRIAERMRVQTLGGKCTVTYDDFPSG